MFENGWRLVPRTSSSGARALRPLLGMGACCLGWATWWFVQMPGNQPALAANTELPAATANNAAAPPHALQTALGANLDYCQEWLDGGDLKSLKQTAEGLLLLADLLQARQGNDTWRQSVEQFQTATKNLIQAAAADQADDCKQQLAAVDKAAKQLTVLPFPVDQAPRRNLRPAAGLKPMMVLLDGTHADAKRAVLFGEFDAARGSAVVLAELGPLLASYRDDPKWNEHAAAFVTAAQQAARIEGSDPKVYREALGQIYHRCEACHNRR